MLDVRPDSAGNSFRRRRIQLLSGLIDETLRTSATCSILDVGGTYSFWNVWSEHIDWNSTRITCVNANPAHMEEGKGTTRIAMMTGNACDLPDIRDGSYDVVFSNSVIEHVGGWRDMEAMAREVRRIAPRYLVQTPNFWFPIEPHARTPFLHWVPEPVAYRIVMARKCGFWEKQTTVAGALGVVQSAKLIDARQLQALFPDGRIIRERFAGLTKALIALKGARDVPCCRG